MPNSIECEQFNNEDFVFHYTKMTLGFEDILSTGLIKFGVFERTNDPLEYNHKFVGYDVDEKETENNKIILENAKRIVERKLLKESYFLSTCKGKNIGSEKIYGYSKLRMWSQYGENHNGLCFVLSKSEIEKEIKRVFRKRSFLTYSGSINYSYKFDEIYQNSMFHYSPINSTDPEEIALKYIEKEYKRLFFRKYRDYRDENEYRFVIINNDSRATDISIKLASIIRGIVIGDHQSTNYIKAYDHYKNKYQVPICKAKWWGGMFDLKNI